MSSLILCSQIGRNSGSPNFPHECVCVPESSSARELGGCEMVRWHLSSALCH